MKKENIKYYLIYTIFLLIAIQPKIFTQYTISAYIYAALNLLLLLYFTFQYIYNKYKIEKIILVWTLFRLLYLIAMLVNVNIKDIDQWGVITVMVYNLIFIFLDAKRNIKLDVLVKCMSYIGIVYLGINILSLLMYTNGIIPSNLLYDNGDGDMYFLGIKTTFTPYILAFNCVSFVYSLLFKRKIVPLVIIIESIFTVIYTKLSTGTLCLFMFYIMYIMLHRFKLNKKVLIGFVIAIISINIILVVFQRTEIFSFIIVDILQKDLSMTNRTEIWKNGVNVISNSGVFQQLFGHGIFNGGSFILLTSGSYWPAHNTLLQYIYEVGYIGIAFFYFMILYFDNGIYNKYRTSCVLMLMVVLVASLSSLVFEVAITYVVLILLNISNDFEAYIYAK